MNERELFEAALKFTNPHDRKEFLDQACRGNAELRTKVDSLLKSQTNAESPLDPSAANQMAREADHWITDTITGDSAGDHDVFPPSDDEVEFRKYLEPTSRTGWLGKLGHFDIEAILGRGAFGIVAKAFDTKLQRVVAIKLMSPDLALTSPPRKRFLREARAAAAVNHENIVAIHAVEEYPIPYLVMEYIPGQTLQQRMDQQGPLQTPEILRIGQQLATGLAAAHAAKLIHRDIKPSNILLTGGPNERAKISDFGLARAVDDAALTSSGLIAGTPMYMAPEQARGEPLDNRADLFSLGSVMYQMVSGRPPFRAANTIAVLKRVCEDTPRSLNDVIPEIPGWLETVIFRLLEKDPDSRYQTAQELVDLLSRCQSELQHNGQVTCVSGRAAKTHDLRGPTGKHSAPRRWPTGWPTGWPIAGVIAMVAAFGLVLLFQGGQQLEVSNAATPSVEAVSVTPTETRTAAGWHGWPVDAPEPAIAPFDAVQARRHQEEWAAYLKVPVEYTNSIGMKFRLIPPGSCILGSSQFEIDETLKEIGHIDWWKQCALSEGPQQHLTISKAFYLGITEVTQLQYESVMHTNPSRFSSTGNFPDEQQRVKGIDTTRFPVEWLSWLNAANFCDSLCNLEHLEASYRRTDRGIESIQGTGYRLPTDAEWEYACRAGTVTRFSFGDTAASLQEFGWHSFNSDSRPHEVATLAQNPFGLFDMHGNVWEFCHDGHTPQRGTGKQFQEVTDPCGPISTSEGRTLRGGSWFMPPVFLRSAHREPGGDIATHVDGAIGFRVLLPVDAIHTAHRNAKSAERTGPQAEDEKLK